MALKTKNLEKWSFALGEDISCLEQGQEVTVPHTWNIEEGTEEFWGTGWYGYRFVPEESWRGKRIQVYFRGVYHDASVYLNGKELLVHRNSGYTPFTAELTEYLEFGRENLLAVKADNRFSDQMLPCERSFDWANDGGMIRPAELLIAGKNLLKDVRVTARPVITVQNERQDEGCAVFGVYGNIDGCENGLSLEWVLCEGCDGRETELISGKAEQLGEHSFEIKGRVLEEVSYWHFDSPKLYTVKLYLKNGEVLEDKKELVFGFRDFCARGSRIYLNGEPVRLPGTEWMPGSDPAFGMAETKEQLEKMLIRLKETNSVLTRFHWQQDDWVFDWCDRNGLLVQEEVPFWGKTPPKAGPIQWKAFTEQIGEMTAAHGNHPSIISWGVGNELDAQCPETIQYIKDAVAYTHRLDPERAANYVSNSIFQGHSVDGTTDGDIMMINEYIGTWHQGLDPRTEWDAIARENPDKPAIPSEFGLCEPAFSGGDMRRNEIFLEKLGYYRTYPNIAGTVYFCLNDYRTQMGEDGEGKLRKRVHGSTDMYGEPKGSYWTVQKEYSPLILTLRDNRLLLRCRGDIPRYTVQDYYLELAGTKIMIPKLKPGETWTTAVPAGTEIGEIRLYRPNGNRVL